MYKICNFFDCIANLMESKVIRKVRVETLNKTGAQTTENIEIEICGDSICCKMSISTSIFALGKNLSMVGKSLNECQYRMFQKLSENFTMTLTGPKIESTTQRERWQHVNIEIEFNNEETYACKNYGEMIQPFEDPVSESNGILNLQCWKKVDDTENGTTT